jgi:hypothetical protein
MSGSIQVHHRACGRVPHPRDRDMPVTLSVVVCVRARRRLAACWKPALLAAVPGGSLPGRCLRGGGNVHSASSNVTDAGPPRRYDGLAWMAMPGDPMATGQGRGGRLAGLPARHWGIRDAFQVGTRWSQRPRHTSAPAARYTSRTRYSSPRQRRNAHAPASWPIACSTSARSPARTRLNARCPSLSRSLVLQSPTGACQRSRGAAMPRNPGPPG